MEGRKLVRLACVVAEIWSGTPRTEVLKVTTTWACSISRYHEIPVLLNAEQRSIPSVRRAHAPCPAGCRSLILATCWY